MRKRAAELKQRIGELDEVPEPSTEPDLLLLAIFSRDG